MSQKSVSKYNMPTKLSIEEYLNTHGSVIIADDCDHKHKVGDIITDMHISNNGQGKRVAHTPFRVVRICTKEEFLAQDKGLYTRDGYDYYEVITD